jgi:hypothetical protein
VADGLFVVNASPLILLAAMDGLPLLGNLAREILVPAICFKFSSMTQTGFVLPYARHSLATSLLYCIGTCLAIEASSGRGATAPHSARVPPKLCRIVNRPYHTAFSLP